MRPKRHYDSRVTQTSIDLFRLGRQKLAAGIRYDSTEFHEIARGLHRTLGLRPWQINPFDFEIFAMTPRYPPHAAFHRVEELHRLLVAAA